MYAESKLAHELADSIVVAESEFGWADQTARNFMRVWDLFKSKKFLNLNIDVSVLYLIAAPSTPEPVRREVIERAKRGEQMSRTKAIEVLRRLQEPSHFRGGRR
jgi:hypothetical protein